MITDSAERRLYVFLVLNFALFGTSMTIFGAVVPDAIRTFGWSYISTGIVLAASSFGYFSSTFLSGFAIRIIGTKRLIVISLILQGIGFFFFARQPSIILNVLLNLMVGLGQGGTEVVSNYAVIRMEKDGTTRLMSFLHSAFCVGAVLGPLGVAGLLHSRFGWQVIFRVLAAVSWGMSAAFLLLKSISYTEAKPEEGGEVAQSKRIISGKAGRSLLVFFFVTIFLYVGIELSVSNWSAEYFVIQLAATARTGALIVALVWTGLLVGRASISFFYRGKRQEIVLLILAAVSAASLVVMLSTSSIAVAAAATFGMGLGMSGIYPLVMTLVGKNSKNTMAVGIVTTGGGLGSFSFPFILSFISDRSSIHSGFLFCLAVNLTMGLFAVGVFLLIKYRGVDRSLQAATGPL